MTPTDNEQRITTIYSLNVTQKKTVAQFSQPVQNLIMSPAEAVGMARILLQCSRELDPESVKGFTWTGMEEVVQKTPIAEAANDGPPS